MKEENNLSFTCVKFSDGHALQGTIEHFCEMLKTSRTPRKFGEKVLSDFDIGYYSDILKGLVTIREHGKIES